MPNYLWVSFQEDGDWYWQHRWFPAIVMVVVQETYVKKLMGNYETFIEISPADNAEKEKMLVYLLTSLFISFKISNH
ncbi:MAG: hypothetical protein WKG06_13505 [Segetibacter sp.]